MKKNGIRLFIILTLILLGGCSMNNKTNAEKEIVAKAEEVTIKYFKEIEGLDVTITDHKFEPKDFQTILISGYVTNDESKKFTASVQYANDYHIGSISASNNFDFKH
ncbi:DUF1433 domain-containing protein [Bacillus cereus]|uniref:DUF1433 domain-containing protein n=1 Tax=Bacillus cereus TaxID=1396 RepID=UPI0018F34CA0|nr:DUF1433 domain-containing protein [Bacillus cereus]MBJ8053831.1 DUF1433 domain-containing protein [Bacillus cereus]